MRCTVELPDARISLGEYGLCLPFDNVLHDVRFVFEHSGLIRVHIEIIGGGEDGHNGWKTGSLGLPVHAITAASSIN